MAAEGTDLANALWEALETAGDRPVYQWLGRRADRVETQTGAELLAYAARQAATLRHRLPDGGTVAIAAQAGPEFLVACLGTILAGLTVLPLPAPGPGPQQHRVAQGIRAARPDLILTNPALQHHLPRSLAIGGGDDALLAPMPDPAISVLQLTSGTQSDPKCVCLPGAAVLANCRHVAQAWGFGPTDHSLTWLPHYHDMGLFGGLIFPLLSGVMISQMDTLGFVQRPTRWLRALEMTGATVSGGPTFAFRQCLERSTPKDRAALDLSALRYLFCGAEPIPKGFLDDFASGFAPAGLRRDAVFACYGLAETTLFAAGRPGDGPDGVYTVPETTDHRVAIFHPKTRARVKAGQAGEICLAGPSLCAGYSDGTNPVFQDTDGATWLATGDLGVIQSGGLQIQGRIKDIVIVNGTNIAMADIDFAVAGAVPTLTGATPAAYLEASGDDARLSLAIEHRDHRALNQKPELYDQIARHIQGQFGIAPQAVHFLRPGALERTTSGKIRRVTAGQVVETEKGISA